MGKDVTFKMIMHPSVRIQIKDKKLDLIGMFYLKPTGMPGEDKVSGLLTDKCGGRFGFNFVTRIKKGRYRLIIRAP